MTEILVAVDGSQNSGGIVAASCELAKKISANITLIYVSKSPDLIGEYAEIGGASPAPNAAKYVQRADQVTSTLAEQVEAQEIPYEVLLETGDPAQVIVQKADERRAVMIVVGLKHLRGIDKIRSLGSVARKIIETANCPVLIVRE